ncbi:MAG: hypothetical protein SGILL_003693 [Bacillariaceae sp.]
MKIKQSLVRKDEDDDDEGGGSSSAAIPPPSGPMASSPTQSAKMPPSPSPGLVASDSSSSSSSASSSRRPRRAGRKPQRSEEIDDMHAPTLYDSYRRRSRSRSLERSPKQDTLNSSSNSLSSTGWSDRSSNTPDSEEEAESQSGDEMYDKYRKYLKDDEEDTDAPWRKKKDKESPPKNRLGAPPALGISYRPPPPQTEQSSPNVAKPKPKSKPKKQIKSDKLPDEDLKTIGNMLLMDESDSEAQSSVSAHHQFVDPTSTDEDEDIMNLHDDDAAENDNTTSSSSAHEGSYDANASDVEQDLGDQAVEIDPDDIEEDVIEEEIIEEEIIEEEIIEEAPLQPGYSSFAAIDTSSSHTLSIEPTPYGGNEVPLDESSATVSSNPSSRRTTPSSGTPSSKRSTPSSGTPSSKASTPSSYERSTPSSQRTTPSSRSSGSFFSGSSKGSRSSGGSKDDERDDRRGETVAVATGIAAAAVVAGEEKVPESEQNVLQSQPTSQASPSKREVRSVRDRIKNLEESSKKEEPKQPSPPVKSKRPVQVSPDVSQDEVSESMQGDDSELWEQFVVAESGDLLETSFGQGSKRKGLNNSLRSTGSSKKSSGNDSLSKSDKSADGSESLQSPSKMLSMPTPKVSNKKTLEDSVGSSLGSLSAGESALIPPMTNQSPGSSATRHREIEESLRLQDLVASTSNKSLSGSDSGADSGSLEIGGVMAMLGAAQDDDEFSLKASQDLQNTEDISENSEYDHRKSRQEYTSEEFMNQGLQNLDTSLSTYDPENPGSARHSAVIIVSSSSGSESSGSISKKDDASYAGYESSGVSKHIIRGAAVLMLLAAIGLPLYFLVWYQNDDDNRGTVPPEPVPPLFPPLAPVAPSPAPISPPNSFPARPSIPPITASPVVVPTSPPAQTLLPSNVPPPSTAEDLRNFLISQWPSLEEALVGFNTPQFFAYDWLLNDPGLPGYSEQRILQRFTLATLYFSTDGENWRRNDRWLSNENECLWYSASGILPCDDDLAYTWLNLPLNGLVGTIPSELALLSNALARIDFSSREGGGALSGGIPQELGFLGRLEVIDLSGNQLQGTLPPGMGKWTNARSIDLSDNMLFGAFPSSINHWSSLQTLDLSNNSLESTLPTSIGSLKSLRSLDVSGNLLTGNIPTEIGDLDMLHTLYLQDNGFQSMPSEIGNLILVEQFFAQGNNIAGSVPSEIGRLVNLLALDLSNNSLTSSIPPEIGNLMSIRDQLNLSENQLSGPLPEALGRLIFLRNLLLNSNALTGPVPTSFANLDRLVTLRLEDNLLTGEVPEPVCAVYSETYPVFVTDCLDGEIVCDCCMFCCSESGGCVCQFADTDLSFLCAEFTKSPGLAERIDGTTLKR